MGPISAVYIFILHKSNYNMDRTTALMEFMGAPGMIATLDYAIDNQPLAWTRDDLMEGAGISHATSIGCVNKLEKWGFLITHRKIKKPHEYFVNKESPILEAIMRLDFALVAERGNRNLY